MRIHLDRQPHSVEDSTLALSCGRRQWLRLSSSKVKRLISPTARCRWVSRRWPRASPSLCISPLRPATHACSSWRKEAPSASCKNGALLPTPFLDFSAKVSTGGEQGLLGLAFDPQYASTGRFVVHYTDLSGRHGGLAVPRLAGTPNVADPASELCILAVDQPFTNHNGGQVLFGPDGYLYVELGDGGSAGDPGDRGQSLADLLGSILRISRWRGWLHRPARQPIRRHAERPPRDLELRPAESLAVHLDPATGDLYIADVGQGQLGGSERLHRRRGRGPGRQLRLERTMEGPECFNTSACDQSGLELCRCCTTTRQGCSITGGFVYRGAAIPALQGHYFYSDFCAGLGAQLPPAGRGQAVDQFRWPTLAPGGPTSRASARTPRASSTSSPRTASCTVWSRGERGDDGTRSPGSPPGAAHSPAVRFGALVVELPRLAWTGLSPRLRRQGRAGADAGGIREVSALPHRRHRLQLLRAAQRRGARGPTRSTCLRDSPA